MDQYQSNLQIDNARRVARIETLVEDMHTRLFGDEDTGDIPKIKQRITKLETSHALAKGSIYVISALVSFIGWPYVRNWFK